jgi:hypothetical protein
MTAKGHDPSASRAETKRHASPTAAITPESHRPQAMDEATKVPNASKLSTVLENSLLNML